MKGVVWGTTTDRAKHKIKEIIKNYEMYRIKITQKRETMDSISVVFENGDSWRTARASENSRGIKAHVSYVDVLVDPDIFRCIVRPCTELGPYNALNFYHPYDYDWTQKENPYLKFIK